MAAKHSPSPVEIGTTDKIAQNDITEPTKAEILADLRQALKEALADDLRPALEVLDEIDSEIASDADHRSPSANLPKALEVPEKDIPPSNN